MAAWVLSRSMLATVSLAFVLKPVSDGRLCDSCSASTTSGGVWVVVMCDTTVMAAGSRGSTVVGDTQRETVLVRVWCQWLGGIGFDVLHRGGDSFRKFENSCFVVGL